nr:PREDICTED: angiomotin-like [Megachile rotundata]
MQSATSATSVLEEENRLLRKRLEKLEADLRRLRQRVEAEPWENVSPVVALAPAEQAGVPHRVSADTSRPTAAIAPPSVPVPAAAAPQVDVATADQLLLRLTQLIDDLWSERPSPQAGPMLRRLDSVRDPSAARKKGRKKKISSSTSGHLAADLAVSSVWTGQQVAAVTAPARLPTAALSTAPTKMWSTVVGRKEKRRAAAAASAAAGTAISEPARGKAAPQRGPVTTKGAKVLPPVPLGSQP